ncbi:MAG: hypothetical protein N2Z72_03555 [Bacteroidales bacterium]|nr:hypothetical protein [Bacteroidales bacterium]
MRKLFVLGFIMFSLFLYSQSKTTSPSSSFSFPKFIIVDVGTTSTQNGIIKIPVDPSLQGNYWVLLTSHNSNSGLYLKEKSVTYFIVATNKNDEEFDYFIVTKIGSADTKFHYEKK